MTTKEIESVIITNLVDRQFPIYLTNYFGGGFNEADVLGINKNGYIYEYEIKTSRGDFFADFKNKKYKHLLLAESNGVRIYDEWKKGKKNWEYV